jgi:hypothetical protein
MRKMWQVLALAACCAVTAAEPCSAVELKISRGALEKTLRQQLFSGPEGRYYLKGAAGSGCYVYVEDPRVSFVEGRITVRMKAHAKLGTPVRGTCLGIAFSPTSEVSLAPDGEGETLGFRDARLERVSDQREFNFLLSPFLSRTVPSSMKVNAADLLRNALAGSTATSGYKVSLDRLKIHSVQIDGENVVVDVDGGISVK